MTKNIVIQAIKSLVLDWVGEILYFPIWWYTLGLKRILSFVWNSIKNSNRNLALGLMFKHMFSPMFGQYDKQGRAISFFMRFILTIFRLIAFVLMLIFYIIILIFWVFLPILVTWGLITNFTEIWKQ